MAKTKKPVAAAAKKTIAKKPAKATASRGRTAAKTSPKTAKRAVAKKTTAKKASPKRNTTAQNIIKAVEVSFLRALNETLSTVNKYLAKYTNEHAKAAKASEKAGAKAKELGSKKSAAAEKANAKNTPVNKKRLSKASSAHAKAQAQSDQLDKAANDLKAQIDLFKNAEAKYAPLPKHIEKIERELKAKAKEASAPKPKAKSSKGKKAKDNSIAKNPNSDKGYINAHNENFSEEFSDEEAFSY